MMMFCFIVLYSFMMYGLTNLLVYGTGPFDILLKGREFCNKRLPMIGKMLECMMCTSTNLGWLLSLINILVFPMLNLTPFVTLFGGLYEYWYLILVFDALFTTGIVWVIHSFQEMCENISNYFYNKNIEDE